jgi:hypothetical protein
LLPVAAVLFILFVYLIFKKEPKMANRLFDKSNKLTPTLRKRILAHTRANNPGSWDVTVRWTKVFIVTKNNEPLTAPYPSEEGFMVEGHNPTNDSKFNLWIAQ